jgi:putative transposase
VIEVLTRLVSVHGAPRYMRSDNGPEFVARAILRWLQTAQIETAFIDPGKPWQNGTDESFNGKFRNEHLSLQWFRNRVDAKVGITEGRSPAMPARADEDEQRQRTEEATLINAQTGAILQ